MSTCKAKNCLGCSNELPTLSPLSLKKIGTSLCQLQEDQLEEQILMSKNKLDPMGKKVKKNKEDKGKSTDDKNEDKNKNGDKNEGH